MDGDLSAEQEKQVRLIRKAAVGLSALVDDLLDLAKVEAGKATIRLTTFQVAEVFDNLQGTILPIIDPSAIRLTFEDSAGLPTLQTDEAKLTQVLRNFLSNAVKFTPRGEIRIAASPGPGDTVVFSVQDTGIGIAAEDLLGFSRISTRSRIRSRSGSREPALGSRWPGSWASCWVAASRPGARSGSARRSRSPYHGFIAQPGNSTLNRPRVGPRPVVSSDLSHRA